MKLTRLVQEVRELLPEAKASDWKKLKTKINSDLSAAGLDGNKSFESIGQGLSAIGTVLAKYDVEWDDVLSGHTFKGDKGTTTVRIAHSNKDDAFSPTSIDNSMVAIQWYKRQSGTFEVTAYLS